ncbi:MAG: glycosyltransferase [Candidatus Roizmanbacteria bacterium]|nr:glycosyltransferase [Candidatus Roizmanbacteria bacterium]
MTKKRIAIVYDWMDSWGGVERMLLTMNEMYPDAHWYTSYLNKDGAAWTQIIAGSFAGAQDDSQKNTIITSFIQKLPSFIKSNRILSLPFYPHAFESFDFREYDLVISVTSSFAKSVITLPHTKHVCILLTPTRWLYSNENSYELSITNYELFKSIRRWYANQLKRWDLVVAQRPDEIISISQTVADRCLTYYHRKSTVIYPPFDAKYWSRIHNQIQITNYLPRRQAGELRMEIGLPKEYFLVVSRLESYKKVDLVIQTFKKFPNKQLIIVGKGTQGKKLKAMASHNIQFIQDVTDQELGVLYSQAQALIMPQEEDFGYVALEAQFFGCPVIAYGVGGACETIIDGKTGLLFYNQSVDALSDAVADFDHNKYNLEDQASIFERFQKEKFIRAINTYI